MDFAIPPAWNHSEESSKMPKSTTLSIAIAVISRMGRAEIRKKFHLQSCIASTRIVIEVLRRYGIEAKPRAVRTVVSHLVSMGEDHRQKSGLWKGTRAGHLVAVVPAENLMIDASIDQAIIPKCYDYQLPCPFIAHVSDDFIKRSRPVYFFLNGWGLTYDPDCIPARIRMLPDWNSPRYWRSIVETLCAEIETAKPITLIEHVQRHASSCAICKKGKGK